MLLSPNVFLQNLYQKALSAAQPSIVLPTYLTMPKVGRLVVVGMGKAAAAMAQTVEEYCHRPVTGVVVVPYGATLPTKYIKVLEAGHPIPDEHSVMASRAIMEEVEGLSADDTVIVLLSGGGSALCAAPIDGVTLQGKQTITKQLLVSGATIQEINTVRKALSIIKGGGLARKAHPAKVVTYCISDVPGDRVEFVASAPTLPNTYSIDEVIEIFKKYDLVIPGDLLRALSVSLSTVSSIAQQASFEHDEFHLVASAELGLKAAALYAKQQGVEAMILSDEMQGEAREMALSHVAIAKYEAKRRAHNQRPYVILSGGEATVTLKGSGQGGRNTEFALASVLGLDAARGIWGISAGTDGKDGTSDAAGAWFSPETLKHAQHLGLNGKNYLANNDSFNFFRRLNQLVVTGPTHTNINDFRAFYIE